MTTREETGTAETVVLVVPVHYPLLMKGVRVAFLIFGFMCVAGIYTSFARGDMRLNNE